MPFTPTHMLAVVPLTWFRWFPFSALAIGTMVPDLPMFLPVVAYSDTHSVAGVMHTCVPTGVSVFILFQCVLKQPLHAILPEYVRQRTTECSKPHTSSSLGFYFGISVAVAIGAYSHLIWDAFSHKGRWGSEVLPFVSQPATFLSITLPGYKWIQHGSTFFGLPLLLLLAARRIQATAPTLSDTQQTSTTTKIGMWSATCCVPLIVGSLSLLDDSTVVQKAGKTVTTSGAIIVFAVLTYSVLFHATRPKKPDE